MAISIHSSILNPHNYSAYRFEPNQILTQTDNSQQNVSPSSINLGFLLLIFQSISIKSEVFQVVPVFLPKLLESRIFPSHFELKSSLIYKLNQLQSKSESEI